jgi:hypothetical protein
MQETHKQGEAIAMILQHVKVTALTLAVAGALAGGGTIVASASAAQSPVAGISGPAGATTAGSGGFRPYGGPGQPGRPPGAPPGALPGRPLGGPPGGPPKGKPANANRPAGKGGKNCPNM